MIVRRSALVPRPASHVFDVIEAAEHYPQFLPWCTGATIVSRDATAVSADLRMRWGGMQFEMRTRNPKLRPTWMSIHLERGPFRRFEGEWRLTELSADACKVAFLLDCEFEHRWMTNAAGPVFGRIGDTMLDAFVERALAMPVAPAPAAEPPVPAAAPSTPPSTATPPSSTARAPVSAAPWPVAVVTPTALPPPVGADAAAPPPGAPPSTCATPAQSGVTDGAVPGPPPPAADERAAPAGGENSN